MKKMQSILAIVMVLSGSLGLAKGMETRLEARLTADAGFGDISGKAKFRSRDGRRQFSVQIEGLVPGDRFDVLINGAPVGTIVVGFGGTGDLNYDDNFEPGVDDPATQFPAGFPALDGGERITVGDLGGTLQNR